MNLLNRRWILENWHTMVREIKYHKEHRDSQLLPKVTIWEADK